MVDGPERGVDPIDIYVGTRVRARRIGLRLSQTALGESLGVSFQQIQKYENGANRISASALLKIADILGVDIGYFYEGLSEMEGNVTLPGPNDMTVPAMLPISDEAIKFLYNYIRISDEHVRTSVSRLVKFLADRS